MAAGFPGSASFIAPARSLALMKLFFSTKHMGCSHQMVINWMCEVIYWKSITLNKYYIQIVFRENYFSTN